MAKITYADYLSICSNEQLIATTCILDPRSIGNAKELTFKFKMSYIKENLETMAETFLNEFKKDPELTKLLDTYSSVPFSKKDEMAKNSIKYSYFKMFTCAYNIQENGFNYNGLIPMNSFCFYGHKILLYIFLTHNIYTASQYINSNVYLTKTLEIDSDSMDDMMEDDLYKECVNDSYPGGIFNSDYERILQSFSKSDLLCVSKLDDTTDVSYEGFQNPLGNMAFKKASSLFGGKLSVATVRCKESLTDHTSKFWNLANFIHIVSIDDEFNKDNCGSPYQYVEASSMSKATYFAQVQSITGIKSGDLYSSYGKGITLPRYNSPVDSDGNGDSDDGNGSGKGNGSNKNKNKNNKQKGGNKNKGK